MSKVHHLVLLRFKGSAPASRIADLFTALGRLQLSIPGMLHYSGGPYSSPEGLNDGFTHGFHMTFADASTRNRYLNHPEHEAVKAEFLPIVEKVIAFDYEEH